jgi:hypothetical protein
MDKNLTDRDVLLVREKGSNELNVAKVDKDGKLKSTKLTDNGDNPDFLKIDRHGNLLENFFENFMRQVKDPTRFEFFRVPIDKFKEVVQNLPEAFKEPDTPENKAFPDLHRVDPEDFLKKQGQTQAQPQFQSQTANNAIDESRLDWKQFERLGISRDFLLKTGSLDKLLNRQKTDLLPITLKLDDTTLLCNWISYNHFQFFEIFF